DLVDAVTTDEAILAGYVAKHPELLKLVGGQFTVARYGIGLPPHDEDGRRAVNAALQEMIDSGAWREAVQRHFGRTGIRVTNPPPYTEPSPSFVPHGVFERGSGVRAAASCEDRACGSFARTCVRCRRPKFERFVRRWLPWDDW